MASQIPKRVGNWNQRPRDAANLARWTGKMAEQELTFQIVPATDRAELLEDTPILYFAGDDAVDLTPPQEAALKRYVEDGGMILGNADCGSPAFAEWFQRLGRRLFPRYDFRPLPADHVIYTGEQFYRAKWKAPPNILSLGNGARELMVLYPDADASRAWAGGAAGGKEELFQSAANVYYYSVSKLGMAKRGESFHVHPDPATQPTRALRVARLTYDGNADPEPGGWRRFAAIMRNSHAVALSAEPVPLGAGRLAAGGYRFAHLTGTDAPALTDSQQDELRQFVAGGGTLVVDAAGGSRAFGDAARTMLGKIVAADASQLDQPLPPTHPLYTAGGPPDEIAYRPYLRSRGGPGMNLPRLRGVTLNKRLAVVFSAEDLSVGLVGNPVDGINGYDVKTASDLMYRVLRFTSAQQQAATRPAAAAPATGTPAAPGPAK